MMRNATVLLARLLLAQIFLMSGVAKLGAGYAATQAYMQSAGVPGALLPVVIALEIGAGLAIVVGFLSRWAALGLAAFCIVSAVLFHNKLGDQMQAIMFMKDLAMAGGLLLLFVHGPGEWAVERASSALPP
jgi:putative oxidoreductase